MSVKTTEQTAMMAASLKPDVYRVEKVLPETHDTFTLALAAMEGPTMRYEPGQFNMLYAYAAGESAISISGDADQLDTPILHTIRRCGVVTAKLEALQVGDTLGLRGPFGTTWPMDDAEGKDLLFIGGGIGLAPLRPAIYHALKRREQYGKMRLMIGARQPEDLLYMGEVASWPLENVISVDHADENWHGHVGVITPYIGKLDLDPDNTVAMICGPEIMMRYAVMELLKAGMSEDNVYITMERNMKCAVGFCGHCQLGPAFICKDGPVFCYKDLKFWFEQREF